MAAPTATASPGALTTARAFETEASAYYEEASAYYEEAVDAAREGDYAEAGRLLAKHDVALQRAKTLRQHPAD